MKKLTISLLLFNLNFCILGLGQSKKELPNFISDYIEFKIPKGYEQSKYNISKVEDSLHALRLKYKHYDCLAEVGFHFDVFSPIIISLPVTDSLFSFIDDTIQNVVFIAARYFGYNNFNRYSISYLFKSGKVLSYGILLPDLLINSSSLKINKKLHNKNTEAADFILDLNNESKEANFNLCESTDFLWQVVAFDFTDLNNYFKAYYLTNKKDNRLSSYFAF